jgi:hypothetical protein
MAAGVRGAPEATARGKTQAANINTAKGNLK